MTRRSPGREPFTDCTTRVSSMTPNPRLDPYWSFWAYRSNPVVRDSGRTRVQFKPPAPNRSEDAFIVAVWAIGDTLPRGSGSWATHSPNTASLTVDWVASLRARPFRSLALVRGPPPK